jgi:hypothetical protein
MQFGTPRKNLLPIACAQNWDDKKCMMKGNDLHAWKQKIIFNALFPP